MNYNQIDEVMREITGISQDIYNAIDNPLEPLNPSQIAFRLGQAHTRLAVLYDRLYEAKFEAGKDHARDIARDMANTAAAQQANPPYPETIKRGWDKRPYGFNLAKQAKVSLAPDGGATSVWHNHVTEGKTGGMTIAPDTEEDWCHTPAGKEWLKANGV